MMASLPDPSPRPVAPAPMIALLDTPQTARLRFGRRGAVRASVRVTPVGLLAIGGLVAAVLLSTATLVRAAGAARPPRVG